MQNQCRSSLHFLRIDRPSADAPWLGRGLQNLPLAAAAGDTNVAPLHRRRVDRHAVTVKRQVRTTGTVHHQRTPASATPEMIAPAASNNGSSSAALIGTCSKFDLGRRQQRAHEFNACLPQELVSCAVDTGATQTLRASHARPPSTAFGFGRDRERWEEVFTDAAMTELNDRLFACRRRYGKMCVARWSRRWCPASSKAPAGPSRNC